MANGVEVGVEAIGLVPLVLNNGFVIELKNVFYVPSVKRNLISVTLLDNDGYSCNFGDGKCLISFNNNVVGHAFRHDKLYVLSLNESSAFNVCNVSKKRKSINETSSKLWHCRLGHISRGRIERLIKEQILE